MTVTAETRRASYAGDGVTTAFTVPFRFLEASDLRVVTTSAAGVEAVLAVNVGYTVSGTGAPRGTIICTTAPLAGATLTIAGATQRTQTIDFTPGDPFPAEVQERGLDRLTMIAIEDRDTLGRALLLPETDPLAGSFVLPSAAVRAGRFLAFGAGGALLMSGGTGADAGLRFDLANTGASLIAYLPAMAGGLPRTVDDKVRDAGPSIFDFIPRSLQAAILNGTSNYDCAPAFAKLRTVLENVSIAPSYPAGAVGQLPAGTFCVSTIDWGNRDPAQFFKRIGLKGAGSYATVIRALTAGQVMFNNVGRNYGSLEGMSFQSFDVISQCAIYNGRSVASPNCNNNKFIDVTTDGNFSCGAVVSNGAESTTWRTCRFANALPAGNFRCFVTGLTNAALANPVTLATVDVLATVPADSPNTDNVMDDCEFYAAHDAADTTLTTPLVFSQGGGYTLTSCTIVCGSINNARMVTYTNPIGGVFNGPINFISCHLEVFGTNNVMHYLDAPGTSYWKSINSTGGNWNCGDGTLAVDFDRTAVLNQPTLEGWNWTPPNTYIVPADPDTLAIFGYAASFCTISWRMLNQIGRVVMFGFAARSHIEANEVALAQDIVGDATIYAAAVPTAGTFALGQEIKNSIPAVGQPKGWLCTLSGTAGTLNGGATRATSAAGSAIVTVNSTAELRVGQRINIAAIGSGPFYVRKISGLLVYLDAVAANTVAVQVTNFSPPALVSTGNL